MAAAFPSPFKAGLFGRCPACGKGALYEGVLAVAAQCNLCKLNLQAQDSGDGPAFFVITIVGFLVVALAAWVELTYTPPLWLHLVLWVPFVLITSIVLLRFFKAWLIAWQYQRIGFDDESS